MSSIDIFARLGIRVPEVLLPAAGTDLQRWAVVACDQYSSERGYWERVKTLVGGAPSTLGMVFPECYLEDADRKERVAAIQAAMRDSLAKGAMASPGPGFVLVERYTPYEKESRKGLLMAVDLEKYQFGKDSKSLVRPTEGTIVERLPPRMDIRRSASLELPHIMLLVDDPARSIIEPLYARRERFPKLYDFDLMLGAGRVCGWQVKDEPSLAGIAAALEKLADPEAFRSKYGQDELLLFAVGDGNHSLATAKAIWEETKAGLPPGDPLLAGHPARFALVELVNIYDEGLPFHPIHRVLFGASLEMFHEVLNGGNYEKRGQHVASAEEVYPLVDSLEAGIHKIGLVSEGRKACLSILNPTHNLAAGTIQEILDELLRKNPKVSIDYIHGTESLGALATKPGNLGFYLPPIDKSSFFATVIRDGVMPRKTFSMGEAPEKRFYIEARKIVP
ncbi:MAG: DUF1015 domain-containing protein [Spirochaetota bacterium]